MPSQLKMTLPTLSVLGAMIEADPGAEVYGLELAEATGLASGTIYPILQRLKDAGWVCDRWEDYERSRSDGRPPRRYYWLNDSGRNQAIHALTRASAKRTASARLVNVLAPRALGGEER